MKAARMAVAIGLALALTACATGGPRRPLFGDGEEPARLGGDLPPPPPSRQPSVSPEQELLERLRGPTTRAERLELLTELISGGVVAAPLLEAARDEALLLAEVLEEGLTRLGQPSPPGRQTEAAWVRDQYRLALDRYLAGDVLGAVRLVDAVLTIAPDHALAERLRRLRRRSVAQLLRESVFLADLVPGATCLAPGQPLSVVLRLENAGQESITLRTGVQGILGVITVAYEEMTADGAHTRLESQLEARWEGDLVLAPGERRSLPLSAPRLPTEQLPPGAVGRVELGGRLFPHTFLVGDSPRALQLPLLPLEVLVLRGPDREVLSDPAAAFLAAVEAGASGPPDRQPEAARRAFVAAVALGRTDREAAVRAAASALEGARGALSDALCAALGRVTGEPLGFTREEWLRWWRSQRERPEAQRR